MRYVESPVSAHVSHNNKSLYAHPRASLVRSSTLFAAAPKDQVVISARREDKLQEVADEIKAVGGETAIVAGDVSKVGTLSITRMHPNDGRDFLVALLADTLDAQNPPTGLVFIHA